MKATPREPSREIVDEASAWFIEFRTAEVTQGDRDRFNEWLRSSPQHIQAYLEVAAAWADLPGRDAEGQLNVDEMIAVAHATPDNVVALEPSRESTRAPQHAARSSTRPKVALAASLLIAVLAAVGWLSQRTGDTYTTGIGEQRTIRLADGSTIELNARSAVKVRLTENERHIELREGQALFRVARDRQRPFVVQTDLTRIRAVGTQFDVYRKPSGTVVTVVEGRVAVPTAGDRPAIEGSRELLLGAGEQVTLNQRSVRRSEHADVAAATAWTQKRLVFEDTPLAEVAEEFNRYNTTRLVITDADVAQLEVSGLYSSTDPAALIAFLKVQPTLQVTETDKEIHIARRAPR
jgi:transmembrane sensor